MYYSIYDCIVLLTVVVRWYIYLQNLCVLSLTRYLQNRNEQIHLWQQLNGRKMLYMSIISTLNIGKLSRDLHGPTGRRHHRQPSPDVRPLAWPTSAAGPPKSLQWTSHTYRSGPPPSWVSSSVFYFLWRLKNLGMFKVNWTVGMLVLDCAYGYEHVF